MTGVQKSADTETISVWRESRGEARGEISMLHRDEMK